MKNRFIYFLFILTFINQSMNAQFDDVELNFNLGNSFRTLAVNYENGGTGAVLSSRKDNERSALSISPQLLIGSDLGKNLELKYGIGLQNYKYIQKIENDLRWPSEILNGNYVPDPNLPRKLLITESSNFLELPILLSYNFIKNSLSLFGSIGFAPEMHLRSETSLKLDQNTTQSRSNFDRREYNLSPLIDIGIKYGLSKNFELIGKLNARQQLLNLTYNNTPISEKLNNYGFSLGINYKLSNLKLGTGKSKNKKS